MPQTLPGQPIYHLQEMLRTLSRHYLFLPALVPSGVYDEATLEAVMLFQRELHPPVTGVVDLGTWNAIVSESRLVEQNWLTVLPVPTFPHQSVRFGPGDASPSLLVIQAMFQAIALTLASPAPIGPGGQYGEELRRSAQWLQRTCGLPETGVIDLPTWNSLARLYRMVVTRRENRPR